MICHFALLVQGRARSGGGSTCTNRRSIPSMSSSLMVRWSSRYTVLVRFMMVPAGRTRRLQSPCQASPPHTPPCCLPRCPAGRTPSRPRKQACVPHVAAGLTYLVAECHEAPQYPHAHLQRRHHASRSLPCCTNNHLPALSRPDSGRNHTTSPVRLHRLAGRRGASRQHPGGLGRRSPGRWAGGAPRR